MDTLEIPSDDTADGEGPNLEVYPAGNGDWYVSVKWRGSDGLWRVSDGVRFCTSGSKLDPKIVNTVALLYHLGTGNARSAHDLAQSIGFRPFTQVT